MIQHKGLNEYYDIPSISVRAAYIHAVLDTPDAVGVDKYFIRNDHHDDVDLEGRPLEMGDIDRGHVGFPFPSDVVQGPARLMNQLSPSMRVNAGNLIAAYIDTQMCEIEVEDQINGGDFYETQEVRPLPRVSLVR
jgi:hypothetical protein